MSGYKARTDARGQNGLVGSCDIVITANSEALVVLTNCLLEAPTLRNKSGNRSLEHALSV